MHINLSGKTAIVTGSTAGIGLAAVKGLAEAGAKVVINGRTQERVDQAVERVRAAEVDGQVVGFAADLGDAEGCASLLAEHPECDILVNNLGIFEQIDFFETSDSEWMHFFEVNVLSGVRLARAYMPKMAENGWGRVVFISSESALNIPADMIHYGVTKTAQLSVARGLAKRMAGTGVTVNSVLPGPTLSEGFSQMMAEEVAKTGKTLEEVAADFIQSERASSILQRAASVEEVANMIVYTCSKQASATTGAALRVDGGVVDTIV